MEQEEACAQEEVGNQEEAGTQEEVGSQEFGTQEHGHISRTLGFTEFTPRQLPSITADGVRCLRSQSAPNLRWFRVSRTVRPIILDAPDCLQQAVLLSESNSGTEEKGLKLENGKNKKETSTKSFSVVFWKKKQRKLSATISQCTDRSLEDPRTMSHSSAKPGSSSASRSVKYYVDAIPYTVKRLLKPSYK
jgi:hypothetical protein